MSTANHGMPSSASEPQDVSTAGGATRMGRPDPAAAAPIALPALTLLCHPDPGRIGERAVLAELRQPGGQLLLTRHAPSFAQPARALGKPLGDVHVSRRPLCLEALADGALRLDARHSATGVTLGDQPIQDEQTFSAAALDDGVVLVLAERIALLLHRIVAAEPRAEAGDDLGLVGHSPGILGVRDEIRRVADLELPILLRGETGTGKELVARAIHRLSRRRDRPLVAVNLGAIPPSLAAAELFGASRGAYTGAMQQPGYFRRAHGGTLFLDEVGEAPTDIQVMLLRVLETGEIYPLGAQQPERVDVRVLAATDADLETLADAGRFRRPLLHRLAGYELRLPPLRKRRDDIARLLLYFLREEMVRCGEALPALPADNEAALWLGPEVVAPLVRHDWPGNIRQLRNVTRQLVIASRGRAVLHLPPPLLHTLAPPAPPALAPAPAAAPAKREPEARALRKPSSVTAEELTSALQANRWDLAATARALGISRPSLYLLIERSGQLRTAGALTAQEITACHQALGGNLEAMAIRLQVSKHALRRRLRELGLC